MVAVDQITHYAAHPPVLTALADEPVGSRFFGGRDTPPGHSAGGTVPSAMQPQLQSRGHDL